MSKRHVGIGVCALLRSHVVVGTTGARDAASDMGRSSLRTRWLLAGVLAALVGPRTARADVELQLAAGISAGWMREAPALTVDAFDAGGRSFRGGDLRNRGGLWLLGGTAELGATVDDRWLVPIGGATLMWATGSQPPISTSLDGSIAELRPRTAFRADILLPGLGRRWKRRRNMFSLVGRTGITWLGMAGSVANGTTLTSISSGSGGFLFQIEAEGCRRLDPERRVCLQVVPRVYEQRFLNGVIFGLRVEWGP